MEQLDLFQESNRLYDRLTELNVLQEGFKRVKRNKGAPGIDGVTISGFNNNLLQELTRLLEELKSWRYQPKPVRQVEIDKPGSTEKRRLGIPCVRDRVVDAALAIILEPIVVPNFSANSFGFIPERNQAQAVAEAKRIVNSGKAFIVDIDLEKFFDKINHDRLIYRLGLFIEDKRILRLIGTKLRSGIMAEGLISPTTEGTIQGSPLSPLLSNIVLDELDKELEKRELEFCRFADDSNIFVRTPKAAERVMKSISQFIENKLKLKVNQSKSQVAPSNKVKFLGMTIVEGTIAISRVSLNRAMEKVKELTPRGSHLRLEDAVAHINRWYKGWSAYYSMTEYPAQLVKIEAHIRRRLRSRLVDQQKSRRNLFNKLVKRGVKRWSAAKTVFSHDKRWALSKTHAVHKAYPNSWFTNVVGLYVRSPQRQSHWLDCKQWIKLP